MSINQISIKQPDGGELKLQKSSMTCNQKAKTRQDRLNCQNVLSSPTVLEFKKHGFILILDYTFLE